MGKGIGRGRYLGDAVNNFSAWLKILEIILLFITILLHRYGDNGRYLFFATAMEQIQFNSSDRAAINMENMGNGFVMSFLIISPVLLVCYVLDGPEQVQQFFMEWLWNLVAALGLFSTGIKSAMVWTIAKNGDDQSSSDDYARNYSAALTMAAFCILAGIVYFVDFIVAFVRKRRLNEPYEPAYTDGY